MGGGWVEGVGYLAVCQGREIKTVEKSCRGVQPTAHGPHAARDGDECSPAHNRKFT